LISLAKRAASRRIDWLATSPAQKPREGTVKLTETGRYDP